MNSTATCAEAVDAPVVSIKLVLNTERLHTINTRLPATFVPTEIRSFEPRGKEANPQ
jgi:hypothetical protein